MAKQKQLGCDYDHFNSKQDVEFICLQGELWDAYSDYLGDGGQIFYSDGGDIPCPKCNLEEWIEYRKYEGLDVEDGLFELGYDSLDTYMDTKEVKNALAGLRSNVRRINMRYWRSGRREAIKEAKIEG